MVFIKVQQKTLTFVLKSASHIMKSNFIVKFFKQHASDKGDMAQCHTEKLQLSNLLHSRKVHVHLLSIHQWNLFFLISI